MLSSADDELTFFTCINLINVMVSDISRRVDGPINVLQFIDVHQHQQKIDSRMCNFRR